MRLWFGYRIGASLIAAAAASSVAVAEGLLPDLTAAQVRQAQKWIDQFKDQPKGPYLQIRWFCNDGAVLPPAGTPCASRGGGVQHAELGPEAKRLAAWNIDVGTVLAGLSYDEFLDARRGHHRLKQLVLESFLAEVDRGWIYRRAQFYRGARQIEDEEKAGRGFLRRMLSDPEWVARNYFLANQVTAVVPHGAPDTTVRRVRAIAKSIADRDPRFQPIRVKIHSQPGPEDLGAVEGFLSEKSAPPEVREQLTELVRLLREQQANRALPSQLPAIEKRLAGTPVAAALANLAAAVRSGDTEAAYEAGAALTLDIRKAVTGSRDGGRNLELLDLNALVLEAGFQMEPPRGATRRALLGSLRNAMRYATGAGLLSMRQWSALDAEIEFLERRETHPAEVYYQSVRYLARATEWCRATAAKDFGPVAALYSGFEPLASGLVDHVLRGSAALAVSHRLDVLVADANRAAGIEHFILDEASGRGVVGLNPGVATGKLAILDPGQESDGSFDPDRIYVVPETASDLKPMAGILTLDSGNALSHAQILAANLGIPNASVPSSLLPALRKYVDRDLVFAVTPRGAVVLRDKEKLTAAELRMWAGQSASRTRLELDTRRLNLDERRILSLADLNAEDSGIRVGPKAANLAQLNRFFPESVAPALVLPFGIYYEHVDRPLDAGRSGGTLHQRIAGALEEAERMRRSGTAPAEVQKFIAPRLADFRKAIQTMPLIPQFESRLAERLRETFGPDGSYGLFVRSDTNAEDLPEFTGAGLNLTAPNRVGSRAILQAIKDVWASPLAERAYEWRSQVLRSQEHVYPSVILMRAVPSEKSGVIATVNLESGNPDEITVNAAEGVSAVVDGGVAESLLLRPNGEVRLLQQARCPYRKVLAAAGGVENVPAAGDDYVLKPDEIARLRKLVAEVKAKYPPVKDEHGEALPWDIEFGFEKGELRLFQIRPLVRSRQARTLDALMRLEPQHRPVETVRLGEPLS